MKGERSDTASTCEDTSCDTTLAEESRVAAVRCCSDTQKNGWRQNPSCSVWVTADRWGADEWGKCKSLKWEDANTFCISQGGRLCTKNELENNCARDSGCRYDFRLVWSSTGGKSK